MEVVCGLWLILDTWPQNTLLRNLRRYSMTKQTIGSLLPRVESLRAKLEGFERLASRVGEVYGTGQWWGNTAFTRPNESAQRWVGANSGRKTCGKP